MWIKYFALLLAVYTFINALLHDFFVLRKHKTGYDRDLLRLLMDGHILMTAGAFYLLAAFLFEDHTIASILICMVASLSLIIYCLLIFPFLKSIVTLTINVAMLVASIWFLLAN